MEKFYKMTWLWLTEGCRPHEALAMGRGGIFSEPTEKWFLFQQVLRHVPMQASLMKVNGSCTQKDMKIGETLAGKKKVYNRRSGDKSG